MITGRQTNVCRKQARMGKALAALFKFWELSWPRRSGTAVIKYPPASHWSLLVSIIIPCVASPFSERFEVASLRISNQFTSKRYGIKYQPDTVPLCKQGPQLSPSLKRCPSYHRRPSSHLWKSRSRCRLAHHSCPTVALMTRPLP